MIWLLNPPYSVGFIREGRCEQPTGLFQTTYPPLTLATLASILRGKHKVRIIDAVALNYSLKKLKTHYINDKPNIVFVNSSTPTIETDLKTIQELYKLRKSRFLMFGIHATYFAKDIHKKQRYIEVIKGVPYNFTYHLIKKKYNPLKPSIPSWDLVDLSRYKLPLKNRKFVLLQTSYGCPYECSFCSAPFYYCRKVIYKPVVNVINEIKYAKSFGVNNILFFSETFTLDKNYVKKICKEIIKQNLKILWMCNSRVDTLDKETISLMKEAGCWLISFGVESGNQEILNKCKKGTTLEQIKQTVYNANSIGLLTFGHFILGLPGETKKTIEQTINFSKELNLDFAAFNIATPFPGSKLYEKNKKQTKKWDNLIYSKQNIKTNLDLEKYQRKAYIKFYLSTNSIKKAMKVLNKTGISNIFNIFISLFMLIITIAKKKY